MATETPVAFIVFNRPDATERSFQSIRQAQPSRLFVIADGPRISHPTDEEQCAAVRQIVAQVDWPCEVAYDLSDVNLGCKGRVASGLDWVFTQTDRAIVIEDDCVATPDFFRFCDELLDRYEEDPRVAVVTGDNFQEGRRRGTGSYYFSKYNHVWGWATWKRAWDKYDGTLSFWPEWKKSEEWRGFVPEPVERRYWERIFDRVVSGEFDRTWDYPWTGSTWHHMGLTATPNVNLVANIGFGPEATHTTSSESPPDTTTGALGTITHPEEVRIDHDADRFAFDNHFGGQRIRDRRTPLGFVRWFVTGSVRRLRSLLDR